MTIIKCKYNRLNPVLFRPGKRGQREHKAFRGGQNRSRQTVCIASTTLNLLYREVTSCPKRLFTSGGISEAVLAERLLPTCQ